MDITYYLAQWKDEPYEEVVVHTGESQYMLYTLDNGVLDRADVYLGRTLTASEAKQKHRELQNVSV